MDDVYIQKVLSGDRDAFRHLISRYKDMAYSIAISVVKNEFYAEEIIQTSFIRAFENLSSFRGFSKFSTWLYRIVVNESFKHLQRHRKEMVEFVDELPEAHTSRDFSACNLIEDEKRVIINEALKRLSSKESLALRLFYLEQNSVDELQEITGWSVSDIKVTLHRGRSALKEVLTRYFKLDKKALY